MRSPSWQPERRPFRLHPGSTRSLRVLARLLIHNERFGGMFTVTAELAVKSDASADVDEPTDPLGPRPMPVAVSHRLTVPHVDGHRQSSERRSV